MRKGTYKYALDKCPGLTQIVEQIVMGTLQQQTNKLNIYTSASVKIL